MKALLVGGTGATGPCIIDGLLKRGYEVTMPARFDCTLEGPDFGRPIAAW